MRSFWHKNHRRRIIAVVMLLGLLLQVQAVYACQMAEMNGAAQACCCEGAMPHEQMHHEHHHPDGEPCCDLSNKITFKGVDPENEPPAVVPKPPTHELPEASAFLVLAALWPLELSDQDVSSTWDTQLDLHEPGTKTYLSTQRLRI